MFTIGDVTYDLHFSRERIKLYEAKTGNSVVSELLATKGMYPLNSIEQYFSVALVDTNNKDVFVPAKKAIQIANQYMDEVGYAPVCTQIVSALQRDMGFLFRAG